MTWTVTFVDGIYTYFCDAHPSTMTGTFAAGTPPAPPPPPPVATPRPKLVVTTGPAFTITLKTAAGKPIKKLKRGTYMVTVRDRSRIHNAHLIAPGFNRATTVPFVGTKRWKMKLAKVGRLRFRCDVHAATGMRGSAKIV